MASRQTEKTVDTRHKIEHNGEERYQSGRLLLPTLIEEGRLVSESISHLGHRLSGVPTLQTVQAAVPRPILSTWLSVTEIGIDDSFASGIRTLYRSKLSCSLNSTAIDKKVVKIFYKFIDTNNAPGRV